MLSHNYAECLKQAHYAECHYAKCRYAECHYAKCRYAESHYAKCRHAECFGAYNTLFKSVFFQLKECFRLEKE